MADLVGENFERTAPALFEGTGGFDRAGQILYFQDTRYVQRVFSSGLGAWCYFVEGAINPSPVSAATTPNWTGSITAHELLGSY